MKCRVLAALVLMSAPALAQPIIIPLNPDSGNPRAPDPQAPPVAPPQVGASIPDNVARPGTQPDDHAEQAQAPPPQR